MELSNIFIKSKNCILKDSYLHHRDDVQLASCVASSPGDVAMFHRFGHPGFGGTN
jgi:hypothetical protein